MNGMVWNSAPARWLLMATVAASGMGFLDGSVVGVALPTIGRELNASIADLQWIQNGYMLTLASLILVSGSLSDRFGLRRIFLIGTVGFAAASALCALAVSVEVLIAARVLQGIGAAVLTPCSLALLEAEFDGADRDKAIGAWSGLAGVFNAVGPFLGGWLVDAGDWRYIFLINIPLAALIFAVMHWRVPALHDVVRGGAQRLDWFGALLTVVGLGGATYALTALGGAGIGAPGVFIPGLIGVAALALFARTIWRGTHPLIPRVLFRSQQFVAANLTTVGVYAALGITFFLLVMQLQLVVGYSALRAGAATLPITVLMLLLSARSGALAARIGPRWQMSVGPLLMAMGLLLMRRIGAGSDYLTVIFPAVTVLGLGLAATVAPLTSTALVAGGSDNAGVASGVNNAVSRAAQLAAVAAIPPLVGIGGKNYRDPVQFSAAFDSALYIAAGLAALSAVLAWWLVPGRARCDRGTAPKYLCGADSAPLQQVSEKPSSAVPGSDPR